MTSPAIGARAPRSSRNHKPLTLLDSLQKHVEERPRSTALKYLPPNEASISEFTFEAFERRVRAIGGWLQASKKAGERVLLLLENDPHFLMAFMGCLYAGALPVPAYTPRLTHHRKRLQHLADDCGASLVMTTSTLAKRLDRFDDLTSVANASKVIVEDIDDAYADQWKRPDVSKDAAAFLQYTSGSIGRPKGVVVRHSNVIHNTEMLSQALNTTADTPIVTWLPLFHDMGLIGTALHALFVGAPCVLMPPMAFFDKPARWLRAISTNRAAVSGGPNFAYSLCLSKIRDDEVADVDLSSWKVAFNGAEPVRADVIRGFAQRFAPYGFSEKTFLPCYGMAEATLFVSGSFAQEGPAFRTVDADALQNHRIRSPQPGQPSLELVGCGRAWHGQQIRIVDPDTGVPCESGAVGEIWVAGDSIAHGYWNRPEESKSSFEAQVDGSDLRYLRTEDLGFMADEQLYVTGRLKDLIIVRGRNFYPQDIEATLDECSDALRPGCGAAFSVEGVEGEKLVVVHELERTKMRSVDVDSLMALIRQAILKDHELDPHAVVLLRTGGLLRTSSGKVQRSACRAGFLDGTLKEVTRWVADDHEPVESKSVVSEAETMSESEIEKWLIERISSRLRIPASTVDSSEPLASYGLESTMAVSLAEELTRYTGVAQDPMLFWEYPTIRELVEHISSLRAERKD